MRAVSAYRFAVILAARSLVMTWIAATRLARCGVLALALTLPTPAFAALGGNAASVDADRVRIQGALMRIVRNDSYALHEIRSASGTMIREYVSASGTVFAVAWQGPWLPDLRQVLGAHFDRYETAMRSARRERKARGFVMIDHPDLVVQMSGHPRSFFGRAYVPALLPQGVQVEAIR
jgi:hypothetical protein